ncbi:MAG: aconitate hydratase [Spirochaetaceae bacterium]|jgi:aconitate hydratase|nr:aconitate hydratase [Spirochaetaceae bacterium]
MNLTLTEKIIYSHLEGNTDTKQTPIPPGTRISIKIDQTLTQDATGTMAYLQFEGMGKDRVQTELSVSYVDHNMLQEDYKNADDHRYLQSAAARYGLWFSRPGNGICHQTHLENFGIPGKTLLGSDSHTPTGGGLGMLAIGAGGLDVALAMAGAPFNLFMPKIYGVHLTGRLMPGISAKDIILEVLRRETVKGGAGAVYEYFGEGAASLSVTERATITNMGAELGATSSLFPSDSVTRSFLASMGREFVWRELAADEGCRYDKIISIDISALRPLAACPHSPDNIRPVEALAGLAVDQVVIGSCTNSSLADLAAVAALVKGQTVHPRVSAGIVCGSRAVMLAAEESGILHELTRAGFRLLDSACGPCIGMGFAPPSAGVSLRTFNRNFKGRSGTADAEVYLVSPETAAAAAIAGCFVLNSAAVDGKPLCRQPLPRQLPVTGNSFFIPPLPPEEAVNVSIQRGPNIKPCPQFTAAPADFLLETLIKTGDNISTDDIMPAGAKVLPLRSNIPEIAKYVFAPVDSGFYARASAAKSGCIIGGANYGQGSSREHAALAPAYLGVKAVIVKSFARIHKANLINYGILPFTFADDAGYDGIKQGDPLVFSGIRAFLQSDAPVFSVTNKRAGKSYTLRLEADGEERRILLAGGRIALMRDGF